MTALRRLGLEQPACRQIRHRPNPAARALADRHDSRGRQAPFAVAQGARL